MSERPRIPQLTVVGGTDYPREELELAGAARAPEYTQNLKPEDKLALLYAISKQNSPKDYRNKVTPELYGIMAKRARGWSTAELLEKLERPDKWEHASLAAAALDEVEARMKANDFSPRQSPAG